MRGTNITQSWQPAPIDHGNRVPSSTAVLQLASMACLEEFTVMRPKYGWEARKIGAGPPPVSTERGWLLFYHGVDAGRIYRVGAALLEKKEPSRVIARLPHPILEPEQEYETLGDVNNVVFPEGAVVLDSILYIYYGGADKCCCLATARLDDFLDYLLAFRAD